MFRQAGMVLVLGSIFALGTAKPAWAHGTTERVSIGRGGVQGNGDSLTRFGKTALSAEGRFVAFQSDATNLVRSDTNATSDVFIHDRLSGTTRRVSIGPGGVQGDGHSLDPVISPNGRFVAFRSDATNLVPGDTNGFYDVFVRDRQMGTTWRVSLGPGGVQGDEDSGFTTPSISADGRFVAFFSEATNLVPGDTNGRPDVFIRDRQMGTTTRVSVGSGGVQSNGLSQDPAISADGRFVAFDSDATNLVPGDTNDTFDVFVRDRQKGTTARVSLGPGGVQGDEYSFSPAISADGRVVAFTSRATNLVLGDTNYLVDVFVRDRQKGTTARVSLGPGGVQGDGQSFEAALSPDGRLVAFFSNSTNLVAGDTNGWGDVFIRDRLKSTTRRASLGPGGVQGNGQSFQGALSPDGRFVAFGSEATNLVLGDSNGKIDVFVRIFAP